METVSAFETKKTAGRIGWLLSASVLAICALWALIGVSSRPLGAETLAKRIYVDGDKGADGPGCGISTGPLACRTIQEAVINHANDGDTVLVTAGVYSENVRVTRAIPLQGGWDSAFSAWNPASYTTTIAGQSALDVVMISNTTAILDGLTVSGGDDGVHVAGGASAVLTNLRVHGANDEGIESDGDGLTVSNTVVFDIGDNGILVHAGKAEIYGSTVHDIDDRGIYLRGSGPDVISATRVYSTVDDAIRIRDAGSGTLVNNDVHSSSADGIQVDDVVLVSLEGNTVHATITDGLKLDGVGSATVRDNTVYDVGDEGVQIQKGDVVTVEANVVYLTGAGGILAENEGGTVLIQGNTVSSTLGSAEDGIRVTPGVAATVEANTVYSVTGDAIDFKGLSGVIADNRLYEIGDVGVQISGTLSISVTRNEIADTTAAAIQVEASAVAFITHNAISRTITGTAAVYVGAGVEATIDHNTVYSAAADGINFRGTLGLISANDIHRVGDQGINVNADYTEILSNTVYDTQGEGLRVRSDSQALIRDNTIHDVWGENGDGIHVEPNATVTIVANWVYNVADDGVAFNGTVGTISENRLHDNGASGIDVDADAVTISANQIFGNDLTGIELEQAGQFTVTNNLIGENAVGGFVVLGTAPSVGRLVNNTLVGHPTNPLGLGVHVVSPSVTLTSANNIIVSHTVGISVAAGARVTTTHDDVWNNDFNIGIGSGPGSIAQNPLLADVVGRDYHLLLGSPCVDAGLKALAPSFDFEQDPRVWDVDIGADELKTLSLVKAAPAVARPGELITYTITITNHLGIPLSNVIITDAVPTGAHWVDAYNENGTVVVEDGIVQWMVNSIAPTNSDVELGFVVTATQTIINDRYRVVTSTQGVNSGLGAAVVTVVGWRLYLPVVLKNHGM